MQIHARTQVKALTSLPSSPLFSEIEIRQSAKRMTLWGVKLRKLIIQKLHVHINMFTNMQREAHKVGQNFLFLGKFAEGKT